MLMEVQEIDGQFTTLNADEIIRVKETSKGCIIFTVIDEIESIDNYKKVCDTWSYLISTDFFSINVAEQ